MADHDADLIRLFVTADADLLPVIEVAIRVLARRWGLSGDEVDEARQASGVAFIELAEHAEGAEVEVEVRASPGQLEVHVALSIAGRVSDTPSH